MAPEGGNPGRGAGDDERRRQEARTIAALLRGAGPPHVLPRERPEAGRTEPPEVEAAPAETEPTGSDVRDQAVPRAHPEPGLAPGPRPPPERPEELPRPRRRAGSPVLVSLVVLIALLAAIAGVGTWELARSRGRVDRLGDELRGARMEAEALRGDLEDLRSDLRALSQQLPPDLPALLDGVERSVVGVEVGGRVVASGLAVEAPALPKGYGTAILTRAWVARPAARGAAMVATHDHRSFRARLGAVDRRSGLAVLFISPTLPSWPWASTDGSEGRPGDFLAAVGRSDRHLTATTGVITAVRGQEVQSDAAFIPGTAGGPVVNRFGDLLGIARVGVTGLVSAIPIDRACGKLVRC